MFQMKKDMAVKCQPREIKLPLWFYNKLICFYYEIFVDLRKYRRDGKTDSPGRTSDDGGLEDR